MRAKRPQPYTIDIANRKHYSTRLHSRNLHRSIFFSSKSLARTEKGVKKKKSYPITTKDLHPVAFLKFKILMCFICEINQCKLETGYMNQKFLA